MLYILFSVVKIRFSSSSSTYHDIFVKEHIVRHQSAETPADCTLFAINIPPYATENSLCRVFSAAGSVKRVIFKKPNHDEESGFKAAFIVFKNALCLQKALKLNSLEPLSTPEEQIICGVKKWVQEYNSSRVDPKILHQEINNFMVSYDKRTEEQKKQEQNAGEEDDEGWTTVTKHGRNPGLARKETVEEKIKDKIEKTRKKKELCNFYTFQIRESKMKHLAGLRQKFEEDKKKITALKQARKFKPF